MRAVLADLSTPRYLWTAAAGKVKQDAGWGPGGLMRLTDMPEPQLPRDGWVRIKPELAGICGSDVGLAHAKNSFVMSAFYAEPKAIPGHEVVGVIVDGQREGERVVLDPILSCAHRGSRRAEPVGKVDRMRANASTKPASRAATRRVRASPTRSVAAGASR